MDKVMNNEHLKNHIFSWLSKREQFKENTMDTVELKKKLLKHRHLYLGCRLGHLTEILSNCMNDENFNSFYRYLFNLIERYNGRWVEKMFKPSYWDNTMGESLFSHLKEIEDVELSTNMMSLWETMYCLKEIRDKMAQLFD